MRLLPAAALAVLALACLAVPALADTPADCQYDEFIGQWSLFGSDSGCKNLDCAHALTAHDLGSVKFVSPNIVLGDDGSQGNFTLIYNQGIEWWLNGRIYFFFSAYTGSTSHCERSQIGWAHNADGSNWNCLRALRTSRGSSGKTMLTEDGASAPRRFAQQPPLHLAALAPQQRYEHDLEFLKAVNEAQSLFTVAPYPEYEQMTLGELQQRSGVAAPIELPKLARQPLAGPARDFPTSFDWRNVSGQNFVTPVRSQASCGSCYAFSALAMMEARVRVQSNNKLQPYFSPQEVVSCSKYAQGCNGGFNYLIAKHSRLRLPERGVLPVRGQRLAHVRAAAAKLGQVRAEEVEGRRVLLRGRVLWNVQRGEHQGGAHGQRPHRRVLHGLR